MPVVIAPATAAHLSALADVLLRNGESGAFKAYVEVGSLLCVSRVALFLCLGSMRPIALGVCDPLPSSKATAALLHFCVGMLKGLLHDHL